MVTPAELLRAIDQKYSPLKAAAPSEKVWQMWDDLQRAEEKIVLQAMIEIALES